MLYSLILEVILVIKNHNKVYKLLLQGSIWNLYKVAGKSSRRAIIKFKLKDQERCDYAVTFLYSSKSETAPLTVPLIKWGNHIPYWH